MKNLILFAIALFLAIGVYSQTPEKMNYQAVVRNATSELVTNSVIGVRLTIYQNGLDVYTETQNSVTNENGLMTLSIGTGTTTDDFSLIDWSDGIYDLKTEIDITGGINYNISGTTQLMSVPFAMYAKTSGSSIPGPIGPIGLTGIQGDNGDQGIQGETGDNGDQGETGDAGDNGEQGIQGNQGIQGIQGSQGIQGETGPAGADAPGAIQTYEIGMDSTMGGYIFYVTPDGYHGLVSALANAGPGTGVQMNYYKAQSVCSDTVSYNHSDGYELTYNFTDWRVPSASEQILMYVLRDDIGNFGPNSYWTATEHSYSFGTTRYFSGLGDNSVLHSTSKGSTSHRVRCIRTF